MRGSEKLKRILNENNKVKSNLIKILVVYNIAVSALYWYKKASFCLFLILSILEIGAALAIFRVCAPLIAEENGNKKLIRIASVNAPGAATFCWDCLFWALMGKSLMVFSWKWVLVYLGIPVSFLVEFLYKPYKRLKKL